MAGFHNKIYFKGFLLPLFFFVSLQQLRAQENTRVLPEGISDIRFIGIVGTTVDSHFTGAGTKIPLMSPLNFSISSKQMAAAKEDFKLLYESLNRFQQGLGDALFQTDVRAEGSLDFERWYGLYERSLNSRWSVGVMFPVIQYESRFHSRTTVNQTRNFEKIKKRVENTILEKGIQSLEAQLPTTEMVYQKLFTERGYELPESHKVLGFGEMELGSKYQFIKLDDFVSSVLVGLRLPTASHLADPANLLDRSTGDGQFDTIVQLVSSYALPSSLALVASVKYTNQLPDKKLMPVPTKGELQLPDLKNPDSWDRVRRNLGDIYEGEASLNYKFYAERLSTYLAFQYSYQARDRYSGLKSLDYDRLSASTTPSQMKRIELGFSVSTVTDVLQKKISLPMDLRLAFNFMVDGNNAPQTSYSRLDFVVYF